ncbi:hypothetical protein V493_06417 [Pseudogymnoascus sp. VKM F-4281 (FW-2241)]|nr:hypothetical protein V493_06417 [Pseudogymnoascus sp. VKM F-4281 (FW-2241)]
MPGDRSPWDSRQSNPWSPHRGRGGGRGHYRGRGRGSYQGSYQEDRDQEDRGEREREQRAAAAESYRNGNDRAHPSEYRDRNKKYGTPLSRDSSEHGSRRPLSNPQDSICSSPTGLILGSEFASAIQSLTELTAEKQLLHLKRERAKQDYDDAKYTYEAGKPTHSQFPIEAERAKDRYAKEKSALEVLEAKLKEADSKISTTKTTVAQHFDSVTSIKSGARSFRPVNEVGDGSLEAENRLLKENLSKLERDMRAENRKLQAELDVRLKSTEDKIRNDSRDQVAAMNSSLLSRTDALIALSKDVLDLKKNSDYHKNQLVQQQDQLREHKTSIKKLGGAPFKGDSDAASSPGDANTLLRIQSVETQLAAEHSSNLKLASQIETMEQALAKNISTMKQEIQLAVVNTSSLELVPRIDALERGQTAMLQIQENFEQLQQNLGGFDDDLSGHDQRIKALESSSNGPRLSDATGPENNLTSVAPIDTSTTSSIKQQINALENSMNSIITAQDASDIAHGAVMQSHDENISKIEAGVAELVKNMEALQAQQNVTSDQQRELLRRVGSLESDFVNMKPVKAIISTDGQEKAASTSPAGHLQNGFSKPGHDWDPIILALRNQVADIYAKLAETKQFEAGINMGIRNLDTRMNNIYTDHLCMQIIGQLQTVYPNLGRVESHLAELKGRIGRLDGISQNNTESIGYIKEGQDAIQGRQQTYETKYATAIADLSIAIDRIEGSISSLQPQEDGSKAPASTSEQDGIIKKEFTERIESLSKSFKTQFEEFSKHLEAQMEGIEHLIVFDEDEDGKVQSVKEVIHVLTENYGKMMGEFDALNIQVQRLKAEVASSRGTGASDTPRPLPIALASPAQFRPNQSGSKRNAASPPSTGSKAPSQQETNKRRRGPFLDDDED